MAGAGSQPVKVACMLNLALKEQSHFHTCYRASVNGRGRQPAGEGGMHAQPGTEEAASLPHLTLGVCQWQGRAASR